MEVKRETASNVFTPIPPTIIKFPKTVLKENLLISAPDGRGGTPGVVIGISLQTNYSPKESCSNRVSLESRYGICERWGEVKAAITFPANRGMMYRHELKLRMKS